MGAIIVLNFCIDVSSTCVWLKAVDFISFLVFFFFLVRDLNIIQYILFSTFSYHFRLRLTSQSTLSPFIALFYGNPWCQTFLTPYFDCYRGCGVTSKTVVATAKLNDVIMISYHRTTVAGRPCTSPLPCLNLKNKALCPLPIVHKEVIMLLHQV